MHGARFAADREFLGKSEHKAVTLFYSPFPIMCLEQSPEDGFTQQRKHTFKQRSAYLREISCLARSEYVACPLCFTAWHIWA